MVNQEKNSVARRIPPLDQLERRFAFVADDTLRRNITIAVQYIVFLIAVLDEEKAENSTISSSIHKDMILYSATIVESCLHYCLQRHFESGVAQPDETMPSNWVVKDSKPLYEISRTEKIIGAKQVKAFERLKDNTQFVVLNKAAHKADIITKDLFNKAEKLRNLRNAIHLKGLRAIDDRYTKEDAQQVFSYTREIIERIEDKLEQLSTDK